MKEVKDAMEEVKSKLGKIYIEELSREELREHILLNVHERYRDNKWYKSAIENILDTDDKVKDGVVSLFILNQDILNTSKLDKYLSIDYVNACKYVGYLNMGINSSMAYRVVFPEKYMYIVNKYKDVKNKDKRREKINALMDSYANVFKSKNIVKRLLERSLVPLYLHNYGLLQQALNVVAGLMVGSKSERIQLDSAKVILETVKLPDKVEIENKITVNSDDKTLSLLGELKKELDGITTTTVKAIDNGSSIIDVDAIIVNKIKSTNE